MGHTEKMLPFSKLFSRHERADWLLNSVLKLFGIQRSFNFGGRVGRRERQKAEDSLGVLVEMSRKQSSICVSFPPSTVTYRQVMEVGGGFSERKVSEVEGVRK